VSERLASPRTAAWVLLALVVAFAGVAMFTHPMGIAGHDEFRNNDWLNCRSFDVLTRRAILQDGEYPLRTHLLGGGFPVALHPSDGSWAPTIVAVLLFGDVIGVKLNILLMMLAGAWGVWAIARRWLGLSAEGALLAAALFALSGWLPSMLLVGFYNQLFYMLVPPALYLVVTSAGRPSRLIGAGLLLWMILQQGGHALPATAYFLGLVAWLLAADEAAEEGDGAARTWLGPLGLLLLGTAPLAFARELGTPWPVLVGWGLAGALIWRRPRLRRFARALAPWGARLALVLVVACTAGALRLVGVTAMESVGTYEHRLQRRDALWFPNPKDPADDIEEKFYESLPELLRGLSGRVPGDVEYGMEWGRQGRPLEKEYAWLGLTPPFVLLALAGMVVALRRERRSQIQALLAGLFALICFGWNAPPDLHFLLTWGVPRLDSFAQPLKYWNFFVLLSAVLLAPMALEALADRLPEARRKILWGVAAALLAWPFVQNRGPLAELFEHERPAAEEVEAFRQSAMVADPWWVEQGEVRIREMSDRLYLRNDVRPKAGTEYFNLRRGVGTVDHYGSLVLREYAVPAEYVTLQGEVLPNPRYRGEAWFQWGQGRIDSVDVGHNRIVLEVQTEGPARIAVNQNYDPGFSVDGGGLEIVHGLLGVHVPGPGRHRITFRYRGWSVIGGLGFSLLSLAGWLVALVVLKRKEATA